MRVGRRALAVGGASIAFLGCTAVLGLEPLAFDGGGADTEEASAFDVRDSGAPDTPGRDGSSMLDAADAAEATFCASRAADFCDDFEGSRTIQGSWSGYTQVGTSSAALEAGTMALDLRQVPHPTDSPRVGFILDRPWSAGGGGARRRVDIGFRALIEECPAATESQVALAGLSLNGKLVDLVIGYQGPDCAASIREIVLQGPVYRASPTLLVPLAAWISFALELPENAVATGGEAKLAVNGQTLSFSLTATSEPASFYAVMGLLQGTLAGSTARGRFDDVRIDYLK